MTEPAEATSPDAPGADTGAAETGSFAGAAFRRAQGAIAALPVPAGTMAVGAGLVVSGITTYLFQILAFRGLSKPDYGALNALWVFVFVLAPGIFLPIEQEVGHAVAARRAQGLGGGPVVRRAGWLGLAFTIALSIVIAVVAVTTPIVDRLFAGNVGLLVCLVLALFSFGVLLLARGAFAGAGAFGAYGVSMGAEGVIRLVPCVALASIGVSDPLAYGLCLALPPVLATAISWRLPRNLLEHGPQAPWSELSANLGYLLGASLLAQILSYAPFLGAQILARPSERVQVADFIVGLFLSRLPILLFQAVQAALLPGLAALVSEGRHDEFRSGVRRLVLVVCGIGVLGVLGGAMAGHFVGRLLFGSKFQLDGGDLAMLAAGSGMFILALTLSQGLIALHGHARALVAWAAGLAAFVLATAVASNDLFLRVEIGSITGATVSVMVMGAQYVARLRVGVADDSLASLVEQIEHEPLEI